MVDCISLGFGLLVVQNKISEDATSASEKMWWVVFQHFSSFKKIPKWITQALWSEAVSGTPCHMLLEQARQLNFPFSNNSYLIPVPAWSYQFKPFIIHQKNTEWVNCVNVTVFNCSRVLVKCQISVSEQVKDKALTSLPLAIGSSQQYTAIFVINLGHWKYLVEHEGDEALFEDEGEVGLGSLTWSFYFGDIWLNNEGSTVLKDKQRDIKQLDVHVVSECSRRNQRCFCRETILPCHAELAIVIWHTSNLPQSIKCNIMRKSKLAIKSFSQFLKIGCWQLHCWKLSQSLVLIVLSTLMNS